MTPIQKLLNNNRAWAQERVTEDPQFFTRLLNLQSPEFLWIGCSDSRVPANEIVGLLPGEMFVHRNVANIVVHTDFNCLSVIEYAVEVLKVKHIIVCGHYGCGGVNAALNNSNLGLIDNWLRHIKEVWTKHEKELSAIADKGKQLNRLCELNVIEQVYNVCNTTIVQKAWDRNQQLAVHGWIYALQDGLLRDLKFCATSREEMQTFFEK